MASSPTRVKGALRRGDTRIVLDFDRKCVELQQ